jgi:hypothetical protein
VRSFGLRRPVFDRVLRGAFRLTSCARVSLTVRRGRKLVKRLEDERRTFRFALRGLRRGTYTVRLVARSGDDQAQAVIAARRL